MSHFPDKTYFNVQRALLPQGSPLRMTSSLSRWRSSYKCLRGFEVVRTSPDNSSIECIHARALPSRLPSASKFASRSLFPFLSLDSDNHRSSLVRLKPKVTRASPLRSFHIRGFFKEIKMRANHISLSEQQLLLLSEFQLLSAPILISLKVGKKVIRASKSLTGRYNINPWILLKLPSHHFLPG